MKVLTRMPHKIATWAAKFCGAAGIVRAALRGSEKVDSLAIFGRQEFRRAVIQALLLLREKKLPAWDILTQHANYILEGRTTVPIVTAHPAFMFINGPHSRQEPELLAGTIAYMACSFQLHRTYEAEHPGRRVPREVYTDSAARKRCDEAYRECLLALGKSPKDDL